jgi:hypothetical protein
VKVSGNVKLEGTLLEYLYAKTKPVLSIFIVLQLKLELGVSHIEVRHVDVGTLCVLCAYM